MYMALLLVANVLAAQLWQEHESGTLRRIRVSPVSLSSFLAGRLLFVAVVFVAVAAVGLAALRQLSGAPLHSVPAAGAWAVLSGALFFLCMQWLALFASDRRGANVLGSVVAFPLAAVGGCFLPFSIMPPWLARIGHWTPNGWAIVQFEAIVNGGLDGTALAVRLLGIVALLALLFPLVVSRLRRKLLA
jgi:ABC-type multidrug transport system permease subunit